MKTKTLFLALIVIALAFSVSCKAEPDRQVGHHYHMYEPGESDDTGPSDDDAEPVARDFWVNFEDRNRAHIHWTENGNEITNGWFTAGGQYGYGNDLVVPNLKMTGTGKVLRFPETKYEIHTLYFKGPAITTGPCGTSPISYALTLTGQEGAYERQGGIAAFCNETGTGLPVRILRIIANWQTMEQETTEEE